MNNNSDIYDFWGAPKKSTTTPQMGASGCTCGGMGSPICPVHGGMGQSQQPNQTPPVTAQPEFKTTREAVGYFYDKQHPNGGMTKMTGPLGDISYYDENLNKPKEQEEPEFNRNFELTNPQKSNPDFLGIGAKLVPDILSYTSNSLPLVSNAVNTYNVATKTADKMNPLGYNDKYKHATVSAAGAQNGLAGVLTTMAMGGLKEVEDYYDKNKVLQETPELSAYKNRSEIIQDGMGDLNADIQGIKQGFLNPDDDPEERMRRYYYRYWK